MAKHMGGCHCGRVRFVVPNDRFKLLSGQEALTSYSFNTHAAKHLFCSVCGIKLFYVPRSHPDGFSVNARCLDPETVESISVRQSNGREWEKQYPAGRGTFD